MRIIKTVHGTIDWDFDEQVNKLITDGWWVFPESFRVEKDSYHIIMAKDIEG
jgi:hypothetical protein